MNQGKEQIGRKGNLENAKEAIEDFEKEYQ